MGLYFGAVYFGQYAPAIAAAPAPAVAAGGFSGYAFPEQARHPLRRGWRWHRARYAVIRQGAVIDVAPTFADALEQGWRRGVDRIDRLDLDHFGRALRRWVGPELARALERFGRRYR
jgi:hypothetical protein